MVLLTGGFGCCKIKTVQFIRKEPFMDNLRERVENALRFAPERMEKVILNAHFQPYFVIYGAFE